MKHGEHAEVSAKWWKDAQPAGLASARKLEDAFKGYEAARHTLDTRATDPAVRTARTALGAIEAAVKSVVAEARRGKDPEMKLTVEVLSKLDLAKEQAWVDAKSKQGDDEAEEESPFSAEQYPVYLRRLLRRLRSTPMNFAAVLGHKPEEHRMALHRVTAPMVLAHRLVQETGMHPMTFGTVKPDDKKQETMQLAVEGRQLPGFKKKMERMLRTHRPLAFVHISLYAGGAEVEDLDDPDDHEIDVHLDDESSSPHETDLRAELAKIRPRLTEAMAGSAETRLAIRSAVERFVARIQAGDMSGARSALVSLHGLIPGQNLRD